MKRLTKQKNKLRKLVEELDMIARDDLLDFLSDDEQEIDAIYEAENYLYNALNIIKRYSDEGELAREGRI